jgi:micrococcal nuclease
MSASSETVTVVEVVDGDTIDIRYSSGSKGTVRLIGVDTPEVFEETDPAEFEGMPDTQEGREWLRSIGSGFDFGCVTAEIVTASNVSSVR